MKHPTDLGLNRTGIDMSPVDMQELIAAARAALPTSQGNERTLASYRSIYLEEAEPIGTVPVPGTLKGLGQSLLDKITGKKPEVLIDKLGERLAFERTGTRLYDLLLGKCQVRSDEATDLPLAELEKFRDEEAQHFALVWTVMKELGADPTAQTPCADSGAVASMGLIQVIADPRTSVAQSLQAIQIAELIDNDGWQMLIGLAKEMGIDDVAKRFMQAAAEEERHLQIMRATMEKTILAEAGAGGR
jgi:rubrerythrin